MTNERPIKWQPHQGPQTLALSIDETAFEILYGGARGGGKTDAGIVWMLKAVDNPNFTGLCIRRNHTDLRNWIDRASELFPNATVSGKPAVFKFPSGAKIFTGHLRDANAYTQFQGWEIHRLLIEELGQIPDEQSYLKLISSVRSTCDVRPQIFCTANPGGAGHQWIKKRWLIGRNKDNKAFQDPISERYRVFIPATVEDNPTLVAKDPDYVRFLDSLPEPMRSAWKDGDWDVFAGQYFTDWNPRLHVISKDNAKKLGYGKDYNRKYIGIDWGFSAPFCAIWVEVATNNRVFCYREMYGREKHPSEWGEMIARVSMNEDIYQSLGDPSMWTRNPMSWNKPETEMYSERSIANALIASGVPNLSPANNSRVNGWRNMAQMMHFKKGVIPSFFIIDGQCPNLERTIPDMIFDEKRPEDLDTTLEDHALDAVRYALTHVTAPTKPKPRKSRDQLAIDRLMSPETDNWSYDWRK